MAAKKSILGVFAFIGEVNDALFRDQLSLFMAVKNKPNWSER
jgi:hypothetical protein